MKNKHTILRFGFYVTVVISLLIAITALWLNRTFYSQDTLGEITAEVLQEESSRIAISTLIVDKIFEDKPLLASTAGPRLVPLISGLLDSDIATNAISSTVEKLRVAFTSDSPEDISINLVPIKSTIVSVQSVVGRTDEEKKIEVADIPDEIVLLETSNFPNFSDEGIIVLWLGPLAMTFVGVSVGIWLYRGRKYALFERIRIVGLLGLIAAIIAVLIGPLTEPVIVRYAKNAQGQSIVSNLYDGLLAPFNNIAYILGFLSIVIIVASIIIPVISKSSKNKK